MPITTTSNTRAIDGHSPSRLCLALLFALLVSAVLLIAGIGIRRQDARIVPGSKINLSSNFQNQTASATPTPESLSASQPPDDIPTATTTPSSTAGLIYINFDNVSSPTLITNQYPPAVFSTISGWWVEAHSRAYYGSSSPNYLDRGPYVYLHGYAPLYVDFTSPVNNLKFYVVGADNFNTIAQINIYQNKTLTATRNLSGMGTPFSPVLIDLGAAGFNNITRIEIGSINDPNGIGFDDFSFTVAQPSPTPTPAASPTPTPPPPPTNVKATPDEGEIFVSWAPSQGAAWYIIKRTEQQSAGSTNATASESSAFLPINSSFFCNGVSIPCIYEDDNSGTGLSSEIIYSYVVAAANNSGTSADSSPPASNRPLPTGCESSATPIPSPEIISRHGWNMLVTVTNDEGVRLSNVSLNGRLMAERISVPYYRIDSYTVGKPEVGVKRGELKPNSSDASLRSKLFSFNVVRDDPNRLIIKAVYNIDRIPGTPKACLNVIQYFEFYRAGVTGICEPSGQVPCASFRPAVQYVFNGRQREFLRSLNIPQRHHYQVNGVSANAVGLFRDADSSPLSNIFSGYLIFEKKVNPLGAETWNQLVLPFGRDAHTWDNFHQTCNARVDEPLINAGCLECLHMHWRWGKHLGFQGLGYPIIPPGSTQAVDMAVVRYRQNEEHPFDYGQLMNGESIYTNTPQDVVFWYSPTGFLSADTFFSHYAWFNPNNPQCDTSPITSANVNDNEAQNRPVSLKFGDAYECGSTAFEFYDANEVGPLPAGYVAL